jgi:hypothetical protein
LCNQISSIVGAEAAIQALIKAGAYPALGAEKPMPDAVAKSVESNIGWAMG